MENRRRYGRMLVNLFVAVGVVLLLIFVLPRILIFFMPFVIGWIIAMIANPLVRFLEKRVKIRRKHGSALIIIAVLAAICTLIYFLGAALVKEILSLVEDAPEIFDMLQIQINQVGERLYGIYARLPEDTKVFVDSLGAGISTAAEGILSKIKMPSLGGAGSMVSSVVDGLLMTIIALLSSYFFVAERDELMQKAKDLMPQTWYQHYTMIKKNFFTAVGGYFKAQFKIMLVLIVVMFIGFEILRVNYSFLLALVIAALDFLPVLGTGTVLWPWMAVELINGNYFRLVGLFVIYLSCQLLRQILQPKMVGDSIGLSPLTTLVFLYVGYRFGGMLGMIIGIPIGMVVINFYRAGMFDGLIADAKTIAGDINRYRKGE